MDVLRHKTLCVAPTDTLFKFYWKWVLWFSLVIKYFQNPGFSMVFMTEFLEQKNDLVPPLIKNYTTKKCIFLIIQPSINQSETLLHRRHVRIIYIIWLSNPLLTNSQWSKHSRLLSERANWCILLRLPGSCTNTWSIHNLVNALQTGFHDF